MWVATNGRRQLQSLGVVHLYIYGLGAHPYGRNSNLTAAAKHHIYLYQREYPEAIQKVSTCKISEKHGTETRGSTVSDVYS